MAGKKRKVEEDQQSDVPAPAKKAKTIGPVQVFHMQTRRAKSAAISQVSATPSLPPSLTPTVALSTTPTVAPSTSPSLLPSMGRQSSSQTDFPTHLDQNQAGLESIDSLPSAKSRTASIALSSAQDMSRQDSTQTQSSGQPDTKKRNIESVEDPTVPEPPKKRFPVGTTRTKRGVKSKKRDTKDVTDTVPGSLRRTTRRVKPVSKPPVSARGKRAPGRQRVPNEDPKIEADWIRISELKRTYREVLKALKPALNEIASRAETEVKGSETIDKNTNEYAALEADLEKHLRETLATLERDLHHKVEQVNRDFIAQTGSINHMTEYRCEEIRQDVLTHAKLDMMKTALDKESDSEATDDEDGLRRMPNNRNPGAFSNRSTDEQGRFLIETDRSWEDWTDRIRTQRASETVDPKIGDTKTTALRREVLPYKVLPRSFASINPNGLGVSEDFMGIDLLGRATGTVENPEDRLKLDMLASVGSQAPRVERPKSKDPKKEIIPLSTLGRNLHPRRSDPGRVSSQSSMGPSDPSSRRSSLGQPSSLRNPTSDIYQRQWNPQQNAPLLHTELSESAPRQSGFQRHAPLILGELPELPLPPRRSSYQRRARPAQNDGQEIFSMRSTLQNEVPVPYGDMPSDNPRRKSHRRQAWQPYNEFPETSLRRSKLPTLAPRPFEPRETVERVQPRATAPELGLVPRQYMNVQALTPNQYRGMPSYFSRMPPPPPPAFHDQRHAALTAHQSPYQQRPTLGSNTELQTASGAMPPPGSYGNQGVVAHSHGATRTAATSTRAPPLWSEPISTESTTLPPPPPHPHWNGPNPSTGGTMGPPPSPYSSYASVEMPSVAPSTVYPPPPPPGWT